MSNPTKTLLSVAVGLAIGLLFGSATSRGAEASARAAAAPVGVTSTVAQRDSSPACHHEEPSVWVGCGWFIPEGAVKSVSVTVTTNNDRQYRLYAGRDADAIFLTKDAALRFLAPYYCCTVGERGERAASLDRLRAAVSAASIVR